MMSRLFSKLRAAVRGRMLPIVLLVITAIGAVAWQCSTWVFSDDFAYRYALSNEGGAAGFWFCEGEAYTSMAQAWVSSWLHWLYVNGRLANMIMIWFQTLPVALLKALCGIAVGACLLLVWMVVGDRRTGPCGHAGGRLRPTVVSRLSSLVSLLSVVLFWTMLPWYDGMQSSAYVLNYAWSTVSLLGVILCLEKALQSGRSTRWWVATALLAFVTAWMHEAFAIVLLAYLGCAFVFNREYRSWRVAVVILMALVGLAMAVSPGTVSRLGVTPVARLSSYQYVITKSLRQIWPMAVAVVMFLVARHRVGHKEGREARRLFTLGMMPFLAAMIAGMAVSFALIVLSRGLWPADLFAMMVTLRSIIVIGRCRQTQTSSRLWHMAGTTLATLAVIVYAAWLVSLVAWQRTFTSQQRWMCSQLATDKSTALLFGDIRRNAEVPWWLNNMVYHSSESSAFENMTLTRSSGRTDHVFSAVAPVDFRDLPFEKWDKIPGDNPFRGRWPLLVSDTLYIFIRADITMGEPMAGFSPMQWLQAAMRGGIGGTHKMTYSDELRPIAVDTPDGMLYVYRPFQMPCTLRDRRFVSVDMTSAEVVPSPTRETALECSNLNGIEHISRNDQ